LAQERVTGDFVGMTIDPKHNTALLPFFRSERYRWAAVFLMWLAHLIYFFIYSSVGILGPVLKGELGLNNTQFGILCGTIGVGTTAAQIPGGMWCDRLGVRKVMTLAFFLMAICSFTFSLSGSFAFSCFVLLFLGIAVGCSQIAAAKAIIDWFPFTGRATAMGIKQTGVNAGGIAGSLALPFLLGLYDWHLLFKSMSILAFFFALFFSFLYRDTRNTGNDPSALQISFREALHSLKQTHFLLLTIAGVFLIVAQFSFSSYLVLYLNQSLHYSLEVSGIILALSFAVGAIARVGWGLSSDYLFRSREIALVFIGAFGAGACIVLGFLTPSTPAWVLYLLSIFFGITLMGWMGIWMTLVGEISRGKSTGLGMGLSFFFANLGLLFGPPLFGFLTDFFHSFFLSWILLAFCMTMVAFLMLVNARSRGMGRRREKP
jgi:sugar phosphate permease